MVHRGRLRCRTCLRPGMRNRCVGAGVGMMRDRRRSGWVLDGCLWMKAERGGDWKIFKAYRAALANLGHVCGVLGSPLLCSRWWGRRVSLFAISSLANWICLTRRADRHFQWPHLGIWSVRGFLSHDAAISSLECPYIFWRFKSTIV